MMFLFRKYKKLMVFLIYVHSCKTTYIKKRREYSFKCNSEAIIFNFMIFMILIGVFWLMINVFKIKKSLSRINEKY